MRRINVIILLDKGIRNKFITWLSQLVSHVDLSLFRYSILKRALYKMLSLIISDLVANNTMTAYLEKLTEFRANYEITDLCDRTVLNKLNNITYVLNKNVETVTKKFLLDLGVGNDKDAATLLIRYLWELEEFLYISLDDTESVLDKFGWFRLNQHLWDLRNRAAVDATVAKNLHIKDVQDLKDLNDLKDLKDLKDITDALNRDIESLSQQFSRYLQDFQDYRDLRGPKQLNTKGFDAVLEKYRVALHDLRAASLKDADSVLAKYVRKP